MGDRDREHDNERDNDRDNGRGRSNSRDKRDQDTVSLLVRNVSYRVRTDELKRVFSRYGEVRDVYIPLVSKI